MKRLALISLICAIGWHEMGGSHVANAAEYPEEHATCNCGSTDQNNPCTGNAISVTVQATISGSSNAEFHWRFVSESGEDAYCGQFANGDYWVAPTTPGHSLRILSVTGNGSISLDDDPVMEELGLLSGANNYGNHSPANNLIPQLPVAYTRATSLVAAKQRNEIADGVCGTKSIVGECVDAYHVVTVLPSVPAKAGSELLRPNITGSSKVFLSLSDFDFSRLPNSPILEGTNGAGLEAVRQRWSHSTEAFGFMSVFPDGTTHTYSEGGRAFRSHIIIHDYGSGMAVAFNNDLMTIFSDENPFAEKRQAIAAMLSYGLDIYHTRYDPPADWQRAWISGAGQSNGKFLPAVFMAALMKNTTYADVLSQVGPTAHAAYEPDRGPAELRQIHPGVGGVYIWGDDPSYTGSYLEGAYWGSLLKSQCYDGAAGTCNTTFGQKTQRDPYGYIDGPPNQPGSGYMVITGGIQKAIVATMFLMPEVCHIVNYPPLVEYMDRLVAHGALASPDVCAAPDPAEDPAVCDPYRGRGCINYGITWGPDPANPGKCITGSGRFLARDGAPLRLYYTSNQVEAHWSELRGTQATCQ